jgi:MFS family permease
VSTLCAGTVGVTLAYLLGPGALADYGWRIALGLGGVILPIGFIIRRALPETLEAHEAAAPRAIGRREWRSMILGFFMLGSATVGFYIIAYLTTYASQFLHMTVAASLWATLVFGAANIVFSALSGHLSDRFGRKPLMLVPRVLFLLATWPAFALLVERRDLVTLLSVAFVLGALGQMAVTGFVALSEALPKNMRSASLATTYALAIAIFGGSAQFNVTWLLNATGDIMTPAWYLMAFTVIGIVAMALMDETAPVKTR